MVAIEQRDGILDPPRAEIHRFFPRESQILNEDERLFKRDVEAIADAIQPIDDEQKASLYYPEGMDEPALLKLAERHPEVLSPYSYVVRNGNNGRIAQVVPYHIKHQPLVQEARERVLRAISSIPKDRNYELDQQYLAAGLRVPTDPNYAAERRRLYALAHALVTDVWDPVDLERVKSPGLNKVEFVIGALENRLDPIGRKASYMAVVGVIDEEETRVVRRLIDDAIGVHKGQARPNFDMRVMFLTAGSGITNPITGEPWKANVLPNNPAFKQEFGARGLLYENLLKENFDKTVYPIISRIFEPRVLQQFTKQRLLVAYRDWLVLHELEHFFAHEVGQEERQGSLFNVFHEEHCDIAGMKTAWQLETERGIYRSDDVEAILIIHIARKVNDIFADYYSREVSPSSHRNFYAEASKAELNFLMEFAGLQLKENGRLGLDQAYRMLVVIDKLEGRLATGAKYEKQSIAQTWFDEFGSKTHYKQLAPHVREVFQKAA